jgi:hypothetical protein
MIEKAISVQLLIADDHSLNPVSLRVKADR